MCSFSKTIKSDVIQKNLTPLSVFELKYKILVKN